MESALKSYLDKCRTIFNAHHSKLSKIIPFPGRKLTKDARQLFETPTKDAEETGEFAAFVGALRAGPLASDLESKGRC